MEREREARQAAVNATAMVDTMRGALERVLGNTDPACPKCCNTVLAIADALAQIGASGERDALLCVAAAAMDLLPNPNAPNGCWDDEHKRRRLAETVVEWLHNGGRKNDG